MILGNMFGSESLIVSDWSFCTEVHSGKRCLVIAIRLAQLQLLETRFSNKLDSGNQKH
jgi:hypothetical protein